MILGSIIVDWRGFISGFLSVVVVMVAQGIVAPHINLRVLEDLGLLWVSLLTLGFMLARSLSSLIHALFYEVLSARITGFIGLVLLIICYVSYTSLPSITYPLIRVLEGFASGLFWPLMQTLVAKSVVEGWRSRMLSIYFLIGNVSGYLGYLAGAAIYVFMGPGRIVYMGLLILIVYVFIYLVASPTEKFMVIKGSKPGLGDVLDQSSRIRELIPLIILVGGVNGLMKDYLFAYVKTVTNYSEPVLRSYWSIIGYVGLILSIIFSHIYEAMHREKPVLIISTLLTLQVITLLFTNNPLAILLSLSLVVVGTRTLRPLLRGVAATRTSRPEYGIALVNSLSNIFAGLTPFIVALASIF